jgi:hypothetical protein
MDDAMEMTVAGMTLTEYAFVRAGLADGLAVAELLGFLQLDTATWQAAEEPWDERILDAVGDVDAELLGQLDAKTAEARTHWTRRVPPLDEELRAWFAFLQAWKSDPEPIEYLRRMGLGTADMAYLHRLWSERMTTDAKLREQALAMQGDELGEPPVPKPEPPRLRQKPRATEGKGENTTEDLSFVKMRTLPFAEGEPGPMPPPLAVPLPRRKRPRATAPGVEETAFLRVAPAGAPLPFEPAEPSVARAGAEPALPSAEPAPQPDVARLVAVPQDAAPLASLAPRVVMPSPEGDAAERGTLPPSLAPGSGVLPFLIGADGPPGRTPTLRVEIVGPSPFDEDPDASDPPPQTTAGGDTAPLSAIDLSVDARTPLPFAPAVRTIALVAGGSEETVAVEAATGIIMPLPSAFGPLPALSLEEHAKLYAELTTTPEKTAQILERYGLTLETKKAEDEFWQAEFTRDPAKRAVWMRACAAARMKRRKGEEPK